MIYGYCRISTPSQNMARQIHNITAAYPSAKIYKETYTGRKMNRPQFEKLLGTVKKGDTIVFDEVSRMSRNAEEGFETYQDLMEKGIELVFLKEPYINTETYRKSQKRVLDDTGNDIADLYIDATNKLLKLLAKKQIEAAFGSAQHEVDYLSQRTKEGMAAAKASGKQIGRKTGSKGQTRHGLSCKCDMLNMAKAFGGNMKDVDVMRLLGCGKKSYYRWKKELMTELAAGKEKEEIIAEMKKASEKIEEGYEKKGRS